MKEVEVKKLFNGLVSLRDYIVQEAIENGESILVNLFGEKMVLTVPELKLGVKSTGPLRSKWGDQTYYLVDFPWEPTTQSRLF